MVSAQRVLTSLALPCHADRLVRHAPLLLLCGMACCGCSAWLQHGWAAGNGGRSQAFSLKAEMHKLLSGSHELIELDFAPCDVVRPQSVRTAPEGRSPAPSPKAMAIVHANAPQARLTPHCIVYRR